MRARVTDSGLTVQAIAGARGAARLRRGRP